MGVVSAVAWLALCFGPCAWPAGDALALNPAPSGQAGAASTAAQDADAPRGEPVMLELMVNGVRRGEIVVLIDVEGTPDPAGPLWLAAADFRALGIDPGPLVEARRDDAAYVRLQPSSTVGIALDTDALRVSLTFDPSLLGRRVIDLSTGGDLVPGTSLPAHAWLDYDLGLRADRDRQVVSADLAFNLAMAGWALRSEHTATADADGVSSRRWRTFAERDWPQAMVRLSVGDLTPSRLASGRLGASTGLRVARRFDLRPGFSAPPTFAWSGMADSPSTAEIYLDGALLRSVRIPPGAYDLRELSYFSGLHEVRVVVSDAFGARREIVLPHYFSDQPLRRGLHEFEYTLGLPRDPSADRAGAVDPLFTGLHRYGLTDAITVGAGAEATRGYRAWSTDLAFVLGRAGTLHAQHARSATVHADGREDEGAMSSVDYAFNAGGFGVSLSHWRRSPGFGRLPDDGPRLIDGLPVQRTGLGVSMALPGRQSVSLTAARESRADGSPATTQYGLRYSARLGNRIALGARATRRVQDGRGENEVQLRLQFDLGRGWSGGIEAARAPEGDRIGLAAERGMPAEGGWGVRGLVERERDTQRVEVMARRDVQVGELSMQLRQRQGRAGSGASLGLQFGGALSLVSGDLRATRPIREGFALIDTAGLADVRVYRNNMLAGRTGADGRLLLPGLAPYIRNQVRLDDRDIPIEVQLDAVSMDVTARARIGVDARFRATRIVSAGGRLRLATADGAPIASAVLRTVIEGREVTTSTGPDGDFYLDGLAPGEFVLEARNTGVSCRARLQVAADAPAFTDLGALACAP